MRSAGLLLFRRGTDVIEVLLAHPGGPFWARRDEGSWTIPKGAVEAGEEPEAAARREFNEETGSEPPAGPLLALGEAIQPSRKRVIAYAAEGDLDPDTLRSNTFETEWPPKSGRRATFPEIDRLGWFGPEDARGKLLTGQRVFVDRLLQALSPGR